MDKIAIVGMDCRFPGANNSEQFWKLISENKHVAFPIPDNRGWDLEKLYNSDKSAEGCTYVEKGGFLYDIGEFDSTLFRISPREASAMDPQQRMLLESAWLSLEKSRLTPKSLDPDRVGVFAGANDSLYGIAGSRIPGMERHLLMGTMLGATSGRISYTFGFNGPAITVDTACSSALVALHVATQSIKLKECDVALVGAATAIGDTSMLARYSRHRVLSPDGKSRGFSSEANGFSPAEGVGTLVITTIEKAKSLNLPILALISGSAVNEDGASTTLQAPNKIAQQKVVDTALKNANLNPKDVTVIEAHGPGTPLGDPTEAEALWKSYGRHHTEVNPIWVGSVKSNIGHTLATAGMAGLIKMILALQNELLPATLHASSPINSINWTGGMQLLQKSRPWKRSNKTRRAGILAYGITGTNAHVIIEEAPCNKLLGANKPTKNTNNHIAAPFKNEIVLWPIYAASKSTLCKQANRLIKFIKENNINTSSKNIGFSLGTTRTALQYRAVIVGKENKTLISGTEAVAKSKINSTEILIGSKRHGPGPVFVFPGQGSQWLKMGQKLLEESRVFAKSINECAKALNYFVNFNLEELIQKGISSNLEKAEIIQPILFAINVSLAKLWSSVGIKPSAVIGHSQGEIAAAHISGALSLNQAAEVISLRSQALREVKTPGSMISISLPAEAVHEIIKPWRNSLEIAVINSLNSTVVSGDSESAECLVKSCISNDIEVKILPVDYASHSPHMEIVKGHILKKLKNMKPTNTKINMISSTVCDVVSGEDLNADYWYSNLRNTVNFEKAIKKALALGYRHFIEISSHPVLLSAIAETLDEEDVEADITGSLHRDKGDSKDFFCSIASAHAKGIDLDWNAIYPDAFTVDLPNYELQRQHYWLPNSKVKKNKEDSKRNLEHPIISSRMELPDGTTIYSGKISLKELPWLSDHKVFEKILVPATVIMDLFCWCAEDFGNSKVENLDITSPLNLDKNRIELYIQLMCRQSGNESNSFSMTLHSCNKLEGGIWQLNSEGYGVENSLWQSSDKICSPGFKDSINSQKTLVKEDSYSNLFSRGYGYGPTFKNLLSYQQNNKKIFVEVKDLHNLSKKDEDFNIHPALMDALLHGILLTSNNTNLLVPSSIGSAFTQKISSTSMYAEIHSTDINRFDIFGYDSNNRLILEVKNLLLNEISEKNLVKSLAQKNEDTFRLVWQLTNLTNAKILNTKDLVIIGSPNIHLGERYCSNIHDFKLTLLENKQIPKIIVLDCSSLAEFSRIKNSTINVLSFESIYNLVDELQYLLQEECLETTEIICLTNRSFCTSISDKIVDLIGSAKAGMIRSIQTEHPNRIKLIDIDSNNFVKETFISAINSDKTQVAIRGNKSFICKLIPAKEKLLKLPSKEGSMWRLAKSKDNSIASVVPVEALDIKESLLPHQVRIKVSATGLNFRDPLVALGMLGDSPLGFEISGNIIELGSETPNIKLGSRVAGAVLQTGSRLGGFSPEVVLDYRALLKIPKSWNNAEAASVPVAFLTAYYALIEVAKLNHNSRVLIHSAAGGVGMAAVQLINMIGAECFVTASLSKHSLLESMGIPKNRIADSRSLNFEKQLQKYTNNTGFDIILGSLAGEAVDASIRLLRDGGIYLEMGMTDLRDSSTINSNKEINILYHGIDVRNLPLNKVETIFKSLEQMFEAGLLHPLPVQSCSIYQIHEAMKILSRGSTTGKFAITQPVKLAPDETVLITGGTGTLGQILTLHLATYYKCRNFLLLSRSGANVPGVKELSKKLQYLNAKVSFISCDVSNFTELSKVIADIPDENPLGVVIHAAGVLDDGLFIDLSHEKLDNVINVKAKSALNLHNLTKNVSLKAFIMYSSITNLIGNAGQSNYAASNAFLDALSYYRQSLGLPSTSIAWGLWEDASSLTKQLGEVDRLRLSRQGLAPLSTERALAVFDLALELSEPLIVGTALEENNKTEISSTLFTEVLQKGTRRNKDKFQDSEKNNLSKSLVEDIKLLPMQDRNKALINLIRNYAAIVLGNSDSDLLDADQTFRNAGFDSLSIVELRARLNKATGVRLPASVIVDFPTPIRLAEHINNIINKQNLNN